MFFKLKSICLSVYLSYLLFLFLSLFLYKIYIHFSPSSKVGKVPNESENVPMFRGNRIEGKFVSKNVINLSRRNLCSTEISLLLKGL